ncbi:hypothetical protein [Actinoplanes aureus]|uniref:Uncharacterized protein n=1 Tax=Actinoplanes aureus TaxID=2792083 RepID=A0A931C8W1_9ACTN|nr:hypothetical protein [Actinoplanes aureus]MBG0562867.1 hypothetical protein [Actinoplanes aureus]
MGLTVVHVQRTGHILGAADLTGPPGPPVPVEQLAGTALPLRWSPVPGQPDGGDKQPSRALIRAEHLATAAAERVPRLLENPLEFAVGGGRTPVPLTPWDANSKPVELKTNGITLTLDHTSAGQPTAVLVVLAGKGVDLAFAASAEDGTEGEVFTLAGQVFAGRKMTKIGVALEQDAWYTVLTLAEGWHGRLEAVRVT